MASRLVICLLSFVSLAAAWLPLQNSKDVFAFNSTTLSPRSNGTNATTIKVPDKIRGVNLGSLFIIEPWMVSNEFSRMGCGNIKSEFDCMLTLGYEKDGPGDRAFQNHWDTWLTRDDIGQMSEYGLNTVRIPVGYWIIEETVDYNSERFPRGGLNYLDRMVGWASDQGFYIILDLHGGPGAQKAQEAFTGQFAPNAGFYNSYNYDRAYRFLEAMTTRIHTDGRYRNVGMLELLNEPIPGQSSLIAEYYPTAYSRIRKRESELNVQTADALTIQFMNTNWGAGNPRQNLPSDAFGLAFDSHIYPKYDPAQEASQAAYLSRSCNEDVDSDGDNPVIVSEWSISVKTEREHDADFEVGSGNNADFYRRWFAAQVMAYEKGLGWVFWSWKVEGPIDYRWGYRQAVEAGIIPRNLDEVYGYGVC